MQLKPRFKDYKILEQHPILKDDTGNEMCLTLIEAHIPSNENEVTESPYRYWCVIGKNIVQWGNKATSHESIAYWKLTEKSMFNGVVNGFTIEEKPDGKHNVFEGIIGLRTRFNLTRS